ncbi:restriction endonuclease subunit S [Flavobacterium psychrophilum]|uniref:restriction endonuclease subunit S n=1 Tax=Flavobacterium psychrophilum TaxID=96345 RepID=UPI000B7C515D|nr:restriction endonuclease subunit S [Flavobacterium psychrophilum]MCB6089485.1 restriction endonuclease subunit S [Flavobacterium psychrophilum]SNA86381.1 Putative type II restriction enzyme [Flavobacterium psychrophilum]
MFEVKTYKKRFDANKVNVLNNGKFPYVVRTSFNNGIKGYINEDEEFLNEGNTISFGQDTATMYYQEKPYFTGDKIKILKSKYNQFNKKNAQFFILSMNNAFTSFSWGSSSFSVKIIENQHIQLPMKNGKIDFNFMESFILNLEAEKLKILDNYLISADLKDYTLTLKEEQVLKDIKNNKISFGSFTYKNIFNNIKQGRRLTKDDQKSGNIPFVMAGVTNTGVVNYISNPVATFPKNSITVDIFGNTFYRNYDYGAGDDTGAYWNSKVEYSKELMLFFTTAMEKSIFGKFDYGNKLRSSQSFDFEMQLPIFNKKPDFETMETFISAILKLVIKDVVIYVNKKLE